MIKLDQVLDFLLQEFHVSMNLQNSPRAISCHHRSLSIRKLHQLRSKTFSLLMILMARTCLAQTKSSICLRPVFFFEKALPRCSSAFLAQPRHLVLRFHHFTIGSFAQGLTCAALGFRIKTFLVKDLASLGVPQMSYFVVGVPEIAVSATSFCKASVPKRKGKPSR